MTYAGMLAALRRRFNREEDDSSWTDRMRDAIDGAYDDITALVDWPLLKGSSTATTASGDTEVALEAGVARLQLVHLFHDTVDYGVLHSTDWAAEIANHGHPSIAANGRPCRYILEGQADGATGARKPKMVPLPYPDGVYTVMYTYWAAPGQLSLSMVNVPWFARQYHHLVVDGAYIRLASLQGGIETRNIERLYDAGMEAMVHRMSMKRDPFKTVVRVGD